MFKKIGLGEGRRGWGWGWQARSVHSTDRPAAPREAVHLDVLGEVVTPRELLLAHRTLVRLHAGVRAPVPRQLVGAREPAGHGGSARHSPDPRHPPGAHPKMRSLFGTGGGLARPCWVSKYQITSASTGSSHCSATGEPPVASSGWWKPQLTGSGGHRGAHSEYSRRLDLRLPGLGLTLSWPTQLGGPGGAQITQALTWAPPHYPVASSSPVDQNSKRASLKDCWKPVQRRN